MPGLSVVTITKNTEPTIASVVENALLFAEEHIVVDTGSTDRTKEAAKAAGAKVVVYEGEFDYSTPRNIGNKEANGDWILHLDSDEHINPAQRAYLGRIMAQERFTQALVRVNNVADGRVAGTRVQPRLFRNLGYHFEGLIAEWLYPIAPFVYTDLVISNKSSADGKSFQSALFRREHAEILAPIPDRLEGIIIHLSRWVHWVGCQHVGNIVGIGLPAKTIKNIAVILRAGFAKGIKLTPDDPVLAYTAADGLSALGFDQEAYQLLDSIPAVMRTFPPYLESWAELHYSFTKDLDVSIHALDCAIKMFDSTSPHLTKNKLYLKAGRWNMIEAEEDRIKQLCISAYE